MKSHAWTSLGLAVPTTLVLLTIACARAPEPPPSADAEPAVADAVAAAVTTPCAASASWVSNPDPPQEIPGGGTDFCQFYQFAWQWFLYLGSPSATPDVRNFQEESAFPELLGSGDSCTAKPAHPVLFVRTAKSVDDSEDFVVPERIGQAAGGAVIYDQNGIAVFYNIRFDRGLCAVTPGGDFPAGTTEIKTSWRLLKDGVADNYFTMEAVIVGASEEPQLLGLVGFHLFRTTADHPEGVWMTWEHVDNAPDCLAPQPPPAAGWSFTSASCAACLASSTTGPLGCASCSFNQAQASQSLTGTPTEICRVYRDGTGPSDHEADENFADVDALNEALIGPNGILTQLASDDPMAIWKNYRNIGGIWVSDPRQPADAGNQRGSIQLTNVTMETTTQGSFQEQDGQLGRTPALNCFGCHLYTPEQTTTSKLSHIFDEILGGHGSD